MLLEEYRNGGINGERISRTGVVRRMVRPGVSMGMVTSIKDGGERITSVMARFRSMGIVQQESIGISQKQWTHITIRSPISGMI